LNKDDAQVSALSLTGLLNILYRGRRLLFYCTLAGLLAGVAYGLLTRPLFRATAQVRPGIVSYSDLGAPVREWALKDIVRWFRTMLYWEDMREQEQFAELAGPPLILADYIASGPQFQQGGDVITLANLDPDPLRAVAVLKTAIASFNRQASLDSLGSTMHLTIGGAKVRMDKIRNNIDQVAAAEERTRLEIAARERMLTQLDAQDKRLAMRITRLEHGRAVRDSVIATIQDDAAAAEVRLRQAKEMLTRVMAGEDGRQAPLRGGDAETDLLLQAARREQAGRVGDLLGTVDGLAARITAAAVTVDTLRDRIAAIDLTIADLRLAREVDLAKQRGDIRQEMDDLQIKLDRDLPHERTQLEADWQGEKVRADLLTPLEQIGRITVTDKPVRPRRLRAAGILTGLGLCSGIFLVMVFEYFRRNRDAILATDD